VSEALKYAQRKLRDKIVILANLDIYFDESLEFLRNSQTAELDLKYKFTAYFLSRFEHPWLDSKKEKDACVYPFMGSADSFIWIPPLPQGLLERVPFELGSWGIENRLLFEFEQAGLVGRNPCESIKSWHVHRGQIKNQWMPQVNTRGRSSVAFPDTLETRFKSDFREYFFFRSFIFFN
jgi:hypothetical protein